MEPNLRDTPLRRFNTFWWGLGLFFVFAIAAVAIGLMSTDEPTDLEKMRGKARMDTYRTITEQQLIERDSYKELEDGKVQVKPTDVFGLPKQIGILDGPRSSETPHNKKFD